VKRIITIMSRLAARIVVAELAAKGIHGMTLIEAAPSSSFGVAMAGVAIGEGVNGRASNDHVSIGIPSGVSNVDGANADGASGAGASHGADGEGDRDGAVSRVRLETVVESHRADEVIELIEALLDSAEAVEPASARLVVEDVSAVVHIRSGRILV
jgi:hypothetical protein